MLAAAAAEPSRFHGLQVLLLVLGGCQALVLHRKGIGVTPLVSPGANLQPAAAGRLGSAPPGMHLATGEAEAGAEVRSWAAEPGPNPGRRPAHLQQHDLLPWVRFQPGHEGRCVVVPGQLQLQALEEVTPG